jgi:hypothetical protein
MNTSKFTREIYNYVKLYPDDPSSAFILENYRDLQRKKDESKKWRLVAYALEHYEEKYPSNYGQPEVGSGEEEKT